MKKKYWIRLAVALFSSLLIVGTIRHFATKQFGLDPLFAKPVANENVNAEDIPYELPENTIAFRFSQWNRVGFVTVQNAKLEEISDIFHSACGGVEPNEFPVDEYMPEWPPVTFSDDVTTILGYDENGMLVSHTFKWDAETHTIAQTTLTVDGSSIIRSIDTQDATYVPITDGVYRAFIQITNCGDFMHVWVDS